MPLNVGITVLGKQQLMKSPIEVTFEIRTVESLN